jgi:hypothetical protein
MRTIKSIFIIPCMLLLFSACKKDNYAGPNCGIYGALTDAQVGGTLQLAMTGSNSNIILQLNDPKNYPTGASPATQSLTLFGDGHYVDTKIFAENYYVYPQYQSGPWEAIGGDQTLPSLTVPLTSNSPGTVDAVLKAGVQNQVNFKVAPYFYITGPSGVIGSSPTVTDSTFTFEILKSTATYPGTISYTAPGGAPAGTYFGVYDLTSTNNVLICINNYPIVNNSVDSNGAGQYYQNQFPFTLQVNQTPAATVGVPLSGQTATSGPSIPNLPAGNTLSTAIHYVYGTPITVAIPFSKCNLIHGATYYYRIQCVGDKGSGATAGTTNSAGSIINGKYNFSPVFSGVMH